MKQLKLLFIAATMIFGLSEKAVAGDADSHNLTSRQRKTLFYASWRTGDIENAARHAAYFDLNELRAADGEPLLYDALLNPPAPLSRLDAFRFLLENGVKLNVSGKKWIDPVWCHVRSSEMLKLFLSFDADPNTQCGADRWNLFRYAGEHATIIQWPAERANEWTMLYFVTEAKSVEGAALLLENGADPNLVFRGNSPLVSATIHARRSGDDELMRLLLSGGADPNTNRDPEGRTALHHAADEGSLNEIALLLENGADPSLKDGKGDTALDAAKAALAREGRSYDRIMSDVRRLEAADRNASEDYELAVKKNSGKKQQKALRNFQSVVHILSAWVGA